MAEDRARPWTMLDFVGLFCVVATLLLLSGVEAVRADEAEGAMMSVDPALVVDPQPAPPPAAVPAAPAPRVVHLNTRGYNYGPPPSEIDPAAMRFEGEAPPPNR